MHPLEADRLIGDAEITGIRFLGQDLALDLFNINERAKAELSFSKVKFVQLCSDGVPILDHVEVFASVETALAVPSVAAILRNADLIPPEHVVALVDARFPLFRLVPLAGSETFVICASAELKPWQRG